MVPQYLTRPSGTRSVRLAATALRDALALPAAERAGQVREAREWLLNAADEQGIDAETARAQYFSATPAAPARTVSTAEALAGIIADAQVANTLIAAGQALGETGTEAKPGVLDDAIVALDSAPDFAVLTEEALHFAAQPTHSADLPTATRTFHSRVDETLNTQARDAGSTKDGTLVDSILAWAFDRPEIDRAVQKEQQKTSLSATAVDTASDLLPPLQEGFKSKMAWTKALTAVVGASAGVLLVIAHVAAGPVVLATAGAYLLILAAILLIGRDYAGRTGLFHEGMGILGVVESLV